MNRSERTALLLSLLRVNPATTQRKLAQELGVSTPTIKRLLTRLQSEGKIRREGTNRNSQWIVIE